MKLARLMPMPFVLATLCTLPIAAQQPNAPQPQSGSQPAQQSDAQAQPAQPNAAATLQLSSVTAELTGKLDSKTAKAGDSVVLKTTANATMANGTVIPKGSKIVGHVTEASAHSEDAPNGRVTLEFDQAQLKSGQNVPIKTALQTISPAESASAADSGSATPMSGSAPSAAPSSGSGSRSTAPSGGASASSAPMTSGGGQTGGPAPGTTVARNGNVVIKTTAVPGVLVAASADGQPFSNASGALLCARQDVHLDGGTKMVLAVAESGAGNNAR
jgi:hypothetical protein